MELDEVEHSESDRSIESAWNRFRASGFSVFDRVRLEFEKPHYLVYLFDSCLIVVRGLHDDSTKIGDILKDAKILHKWSKDCRLGVFPAFKRCFSSIRNFSSIQKVFFQHPGFLSIENWTFSSIQKVFFQHLRFLSISTWSERSDRAGGACGNCGNCC